MEPSADSINHDESLAKLTAQKIEQAAARARKAGLAFVVLACCIVLAAIATMLVLGLKVQHLQESNNKLLDNQAKAAMEGAKIVDEFRIRFASEQEVIKQGQLCVLSQLVKMEIDNVTAHALLARGQHVRLHVPANLKPPEVPKDLEPTCAQFLGDGVSGEVEQALNMPALPTNTIPNATTTTTKPVPVVAGPPGPAGAQGPPGPKGDQGFPPNAPPPFPPPVPQPPSPIDKLLKDTRCLVLRQCKDYASNKEAHGFHQGSPYSWRRYPLLTWSYPWDLS